MSYLSLLIALFKSQDNLTGSAWWDNYLDQLVIVETWFFHASWWIWAVVMIVGALASVFIKDLRNAGCGCYFLVLGVILGLLPLWEWISMKLAMGMASSVSAEGIVNQGKLILNALLFFLLGAG